MCRRPEPGRESINSFVNRALPVIFYFVGYVSVVLGVLYLITPVGSLPTFMGGIHHGRLAYHTKRADVALILGLIILAASTWLFRRSIARVREHQYFRLDPSAMDDRSTEDDFV